jgi:hypothetical protein
LYHYLQKWSWEKQVFFGFKTRVGVLIPRQKKKKRFSARIGLPLASRFFAPVKVSHSQNWNAQKKGRKPLGKPTKNANPPKEPNSSFANSGKPLILTHGTKVSVKAFCILSLHRPSLTSSQPCTPELLSP